MRIVLGVLSLLVVVAIIGVLAKKQLASVPAPAGVAAEGVSVPTGTPKQQVDQFKQSVEGAMQQSRPVTDETK